MDILLLDFLFWSINKSIDTIFKLLLKEDSNAGKTSIILRYTENKFEASGISTLGVDIKFKFVSFDYIKTEFIDI